MGWLRDLLSPSNLWTALQYLCPPAAAIISAGLSWFQGLPPSVIMGLALIAAACVVIIVDALRSWFDRRNSQLQRIAQLEERFRSKIKVLGLQQKYNAANSDRTFELEVKNDSEVELSNCLAKVTSITLVKTNIDGIELDYSTPYRTSLPLALRTAKNTERDGGGPFHLRAGETKKILICSRQDGHGKDLRINFEPNAPDFMSGITFISTCDLEIDILGASNPPREKLHLVLKEDRLMVTRDAT